MTPTRSLLPLVVAVVSSFGLTSCGSGKPTPHQGATIGRVSLAFNGAVTGLAEGPAVVRCFEPAEHGDAFSVSVDADFGLPIGGTVFRSLDVEAVGYDGPKPYDLGTALRSDAVERDDFFLLFGSSPEPFGWGGTGSAGTVTVDRGERRGSIALVGWENGQGQRIDLNGTFACGAPLRS
jgi:hypothetical protein